MRLNEANESEILILFQFTSYWTQPCLVGLGTSRDSDTRGGYCPETVRSVLLCSTRVR